MGVDKTVNQVVFDLLQFRRSTPGATKELATLSHNSGLLPLLQSKIEEIASAFNKYHRITYDIQGPRDRGADVVFRQTNDEDDYICFQVKSETDVREKNLIGTLKCQHFDFCQQYPDSTDYYIVLCCDISESVMRDPDWSKKRRTKNTNRDRVRSVEAEFVKVKGVHVVEPDYALAFLKLPTIQIDAVIKAKVGEEDEVLRQAMDLVADLTPTELAIIVHFVHAFLYEQRVHIFWDRVLDDSFVADCYAMVPDWDRDEFFEPDEFPQERGWDLQARLGEDIEQLSSVFLVALDDGYFAVSPDEVAPLVAVMSDGNVRYSYAGKELEWYTWMLLAPEFSARFGRD
jgi:hypothetical protein